MFHADHRRAVDFAGAVNVDAVGMFDRCRQPAFADDRIVIETWVAGMRKATSVRRYRIKRERDGTLLATAETKWAFIEFASGRPRRIPPEIARAFVVRGSEG